MTALVDRWLAEDHDVHVVTSLPWYTRHQVDDGWRGRLFKRGFYGSAKITRLYPFPVKKSKFEHEYG